MEAGDQEHAPQERLPPGFRFHPTDEELITYYLINKITDSTFTERAVADVDLNKCEPWDLPGKAKMGEKEWYFFSLRDRKYPTGVRTNRATNSGYWKTTGKDREIYTTNNSSSSVEELVGMKKTLVFYRGRAPRGEKTNWVMHEYRIHAKSSYRTSTAAKDEWVVCRVIQKSGGVKKYSSNHSHSNSRAVNPYNLEIGPSGSMMTNSQMMMMQQQQPPDAYHQFPVGRNYISHTELEQLSRINYRGVSTNSLNFPAQSQLNYGHVGGGAAAAAAFTMSGLNLNLGGATMTQPPIPLSAGINQHDVTSSMLPNAYASTTTDQMNNNANANAMGGRYAVGMDQYADSDNYWPPY